MSALLRPFMSRLVTKPCFSLTPFKAVLHSPSGSSLGCSSRIGSTAARRWGTCPWEHLDEHEREGVGLGKSFSLSLSLLRRSVPRQRGLQAAGRLRERCILPRPPRRRGPLLGRKARKTRNRPRLTRVTRVGCNDGDDIFIKPAVGRGVAATRTGGLMGRAGVSIFRADEWREGGCDGVEVGGWRHEGVA